MTDPIDQTVRFRALFAECSLPLLGYALRRCPRREDAADVVAEVFLVAWRRIDSVPAGDEARLWLYGVARRVLANQRRGELRRSNLGERLRAELAGLDLGTLDVDPTTTLVVRRAIAGLDAADRELLWLTSWEGLAPTEIAVVLGIEPVTVRTRLHRARARLRAALATDDIEGERTDVSGHVGTGGRVPARHPRSER